MGRPRQEQEDYPGGTTKGMELPYDAARKKSIIQEPPIKVGGNLKMKKIKESLNKAFFDQEALEEKVTKTMNLLDAYLNEMCGKDHGDEEEVTETENEIDNVPEEDPAEQLLDVRKDIAEIKQILTKLSEETEYRKYFKSMLDKYGVSSPSELDAEKKKEFFNAVSSGWKGSKE
jgi:hypothetical protein